MADDLVAVVDEEDILNEEDSLQEEPVIVNINNVNGEQKRPVRTGGLSCQVDLGTGSTRCCVQNCSTNKLSRSRNSQVTFVTFPKDPCRFAEWTRAIQRSDLLSLAGKKEALDLLVCSRHFSEDMWVNSNTRLKRLHKNAVPEINPSDMPSVDDDDFDIIEITGSTPALKPAPKKGGLKVRKVSSLLSESALKESLSPSLSEKYTMMNASSLTSLTKPTASARKWPSLLSRQKNTTGGSNAPGGTPNENKLKSENAQLKSELDKNMDYILNQKAHYEGLLQQEKTTSENLQSKLSSLETAQRKLWQTYETQLQAQKAVVTNKDEGRHEKLQIKNLQKTNENLDKEARELRKKVTELTYLNREVEDALHEATANRPPTPPPAEPNFTGESFMTFLKHHLVTEERLRMKVASLTEALNTRELPEKQKELLVDLGKRHLNHLQASLLEAMVDVEQTPESKARFLELWKALQESSCSSAAVTAVMGALGIVEPPAMMQYSTAGSSINALYDELEKAEMHSHRTSHVANFLKNEYVKMERELSPPIKRRRRDEEEDDEREEGIASDDDEQLVFSDSEEEEDYEVEEQEAQPTATLAPDQVVKTPAATFEFLLGGAEEPVPGISGSMPLLVSDAGMETDSSPRKGMSNRKSRVITASDSVVANAGSKVIYRVLES